MSGTGSITSEEWDRIREFANLSPEERTPAILRPGSSRDPIPPEERTADDENGTGTGNDSPPYSSGVRPKTCRAIRERMATATTAREVVEAYPSRHTCEVMRHAYGDCTHTHDTPPTASPQIGAGECQAFREEFAGGYLVSEIAEEWARSENTVTRHIYGRCSHPSTPRRLPPREVETAECDRLRRLYGRNETVGLDSVSTALRLRPEVASTHLFGYCKCGGSEPPADRANAAEDVEDANTRKQA